MTEKLLRFWKDPVWSKIISVIIISTVTIIYNFINSKINQTDFIYELQSFFSIKINLWLILFLLFILYIGYYFIKKKQRNRNTNKFRYDIETLQLDRILFDKIRNEYIHIQAIMCLANNSFSSGPFASEELDFMDKISNENLNPNFEFLNPNLEKVKQELFLSVEQLRDCINSKTFSTNTPKHIDDIWPCIPKEWEYDFFMKAKSEIQKLENDTYQRLIEFTRTGRRILKI